MNEILLLVDFTTLKNEFAVAEKATTVAYNLSKMDFLSKNVEKERSTGKALSHLISVFGRWVVVFNLVRKGKGEDNSMLFFDLDIDLELLEAANEGDEALNRGIVRALQDYKKVFDPKVHDVVRLVRELPS